MLGSWDAALFRWINTSWSHPVADEVFRFFSLATTLRWAVYGLLGVLLIMIVRGGNWRRAALLSMLAWPLANAFCDIAKSVYPALRPCIELAGVNLVYEYGTGQLMFLDSSGTISAHSANMAAVATAMMMCSKWWGVVWTIVAFLTGISRVYTGAHYPSQVLLGWLAGAMCAYIVVRTWRAYVDLRARKAAVA